mgnify:CR=1 FL=1
MKLKYIFDKKIETYIHYLILTAFLFFAFYLGDYFLSLSDISPVLMFIYWFVVVSFSDQIIKFSLNQY